VCDLELRDTDFTDDRLSILLKQLSDDQTWADIEPDLTQKTLRVYDLSVEQVRLDATTISGHHLISDAGLFQFGHSKDDPTLPQVKLMMGMADPLGMPIVTQVMSGEHADDGLYIPELFANHLDTGHSQPAVRGGLQDECLGHSWLYPSSRALLLKSQAP
jgi:transposase